MNVSLGRLPCKNRRSKEGNVCVSAAKRFAATYLFLCKIARGAENWELASDFLSKRYAIRTDDRRFAFQVCATWHSGGRRIKKIGARGASARPDAAPLAQAFLAKRHASERVPGGRFALPQRHANAPCPLRHVRPAPWGSWGKIATLWPMQIGAGIAGRQI